MDARPHTHCRLCSAELPPPFLDLGETALANELGDSPDVEQDTFPLQLVQCSACEHVQLTVAVDPKRLFPPTYPYQSGTSPVFRVHLAELCAVVEQHKPEGGHLLDIGSNDGSFLGCFSGSGWAVTGIDPAAPERKGVRALFTHEWAKSWTHWKFDVITALNVFAHVDDLNDFTAGVAELLADDGVFIFEVGYWPDVVEKGLLGCVYHEHVSYHHLRPLVPFFGRHNLILYDAERVDSQGGSVRCFVRRNDRGERSRRLCAMLDDEGKLDVSRLEARVAQLNQLGYELYERYNVMAGYGAPAKLTTLCHVMNFDDVDLPCIFDDNPLKVGKYTPGTHIPIVSSAELMQRNPDALVLFSANFREEIQSRFPDWKGEWIIP